MAAVDSRDQQIAALTRENVTKSLQGEDELKRAQAACADLQQHVDSLRAQVCEHTESISEMKVAREELEMRHADQVGAHQLMFSCCKLRQPWICAANMDLCSTIMS